MNSGVKKKFVKSEFLKALENEDLVTIEAYIEHKKSFLETACGKISFKNWQLHLKPLAYTIVHKKMNAAQLLIRKGADCTVKYHIIDPNLLTTTYSLLSIAVCFKSSKIAKMLLVAMRNSKHFTKSINHAAQICAQTGQGIMLEFLILQGANIHVSNNFNDFQNSIIEMATAKRMAIIEKEKQYELGKTLALIAQSGEFKDIYYTIAHTHYYTGIAYKAYINKTTEDIPKITFQTEPSLSDKLIESFKKLKF